MFKSFKDALHNKLYSWLCKDRIEYNRRKIYEVQNYAQELEARIDLQVRHMSYLRSEILEAKEFIKRTTVAHADIDIRGQSTVIVLGRYHNRDYVRCFNVGPGEFHEVIEHLKVLTKNASLGHVDAAPGIEIAVNSLVQNDVK